ncbi:thioredoxin domain-containing protein [Filibacter tadaridae]|uniref:Cellobiose 2-epimerase n=1 Tax=Filibacter tadaridae TaxID=2483811 RepID=A0A3P5WT54_9BACL|nr:thioredoxin domain-containing protein [Filibacter tadaridae]VDC24815.1 Cellobiose 2-epimerase [Filibacter tadaridae]
MDRQPNRLRMEKSPYLLQHAYNPVDWYPWGPEAFDKAKRENKPVFVSIGYSTCHWCHVMEEESFEDDEVAALLNEHFVSIKVDREERPDIDAIYMEVCIQQTGQGGWPLNAFLTYDQKPFYVGTYFPKESKYGRPGMMDVLHQLAETYQSEPEHIQQISEGVANTLKPRARTAGDEVPSDAMHAAFQQLSQQFDTKYGGFGGAPKFPSPSQLLFLLRYAKWTGEDKALLMVEKTLHSIANGGIMDHIGGGFARYSTDEMWLVPHFEKMLHDQALLLSAFTEAYQMTRNPRYKEIVYSTVAFLKREMTHPDGGFYSAIDADSEGEEGTYYIWSENEVLALLGETKGNLFCDAYDISEEGNFEGKNIPHLIGTDMKKLAEEHEMSEVTAWQTLEECRKQLLKEREKRVYPHLDDKILTAWNGLTIAALAKAGATFKEPAFIDMAEKATSFIEKHLSEDDFLHARFRDGEAKFLGYVDDYAFLLWGYIDLHQATGSDEHLKRAITLSVSLFKRFGSEEHGGFYFTDQDAEKLLVRDMTIMEGAMPSGNGVAALQLWRLAKLTGNHKLLQKVEQLMSAFTDEVINYPTGVLTLLTARMAFEVGGKEIVVSGSSAAGKNEILEFLHTTFHPFDVWLEAEYESNTETIALTEGKYSDTEPLVVYVCEHSVCSAPVRDVGSFLEKMD